MSRVTGFVLPALSIGLGSLYLRPQRGFYPLPSDLGPVQPLEPQTTIEEVHRDELEITEHPVERGAAIADHAYKRPAEVIIKCGWSNSPPTNPGGIIGSAIGVGQALFPSSRVTGAIAQTGSAIGSILSGNGASQIKSIYQQLLSLQSSATLFDVYTGKRVYKDMLFKSLSVTTDADSENSLLIIAVCRQVILTTTRTVSIPVNSAAQSQPQKTTPVQNAGGKQLQATP